MTSATLANSSSLLSFSIATFFQKLGGAAIENDHLGVLAEIQCVNIMNCGKELGNTAIIFDGKNVLHILGHESFIPTLHHL